MIAGHEARRAGAQSEFLDRCAGRLGKRRMTGQAQIIVARERDESPAAALDYHAVVTHRGHEHAAQVPAFKRGQFGLHEVVEGGHTFPILTVRSDLTASLPRGGLVNKRGPHPEEAALLGGRLEGWPLARPCLLPSFETRARARSSG